MISRSLFKAASLEVRQPEQSLSFAFSTSLRQPPLRYPADLLEGVLGDSPTLVEGVESGCESLFNVFIIAFRSKVIEILPAA